MVQYEVVWQAAITELNTVAVEEDVFVVVLAVDYMVMVAANILLAKDIAPLLVAAYTQVLEARRYYHQYYYHQRCCSFHELPPMMPTPIMVVIMVAMLAWRFYTHFAHKH